MTQRTRPPTAADIGRTVQFGNNLTGALRKITHYYDQTVYRVERDGVWYGVYYATIAYDCPDPVAELHYAVDQLVEAGHEEAARVLIAELKRPS